MVITFVFVKFATTNYNSDDLLGPAENLQEVTFFDVFLRD